MQCSNIIHNHFLVNTPLYNITIRIINFKCNHQESGLRLNSVRSFYNIYRFLKVTRTLPMSVTEVPSKRNQLKLTI